MKIKQKKLPLFFDGGVPDPNSPDYQEYLDWLKLTGGSDFTGGIVLDPADQKNYDDFLLFKQNNNKTPGGMPDLRTNNTGTPTNTPTPKRDFSNIYGTPKAVEYPTTPENTGKEDAANALKNAPKDKNNLFNYTPIVFSGIDSLLKKVDDEQQSNQETEYRRKFSHPDEYVNSQMYGKNQNSQDLSVSDTALTANGAKVQGDQLIPIEAEGGEDVISDGVTTELKGNSHEKGGIKLNLKPESMILSDRLKPSEISNIQDLKHIFEVRNITKNSTYADVDKALNKKFKVEDNQKILGSSKYDALFKKTADLKQEQANKAKSVLFQIQQLHNGDSNGESKMPDGGGVKDPNKVPEYRTSNYSDYVNRKQAYNDSLSLHNISTEKTNQYNNIINTSNTDKEYEERALRYGDIPYKNASVSLNNEWKKHTNWLPTTSYTHADTHYTDGSGIRRKHLQNYEFKKPTQPVTFVPDPTIVAKQKLIGVNPDGVWGPKSEEAWKKYNTPQTTPVPTPQNNNTPALTPEKPKTTPIGTLKIAGKEIPYYSEEELKKLQDSLSIYGTVHDQGDYSKTKTKFFKGQDFRGWNNKGELVDKQGKVIYTPKLAMGGKVEYKVGQQYDLSKEQIQELKKLGYKIK